MNENERGITPANVTAMTMDLRNEHWHIIIEQGNGNVIKIIELTPMERVELAALLGMGSFTQVAHLEFVDVFSQAEGSEDQS